MEAVGAFGHRKEALDDRSSGVPEGSIDEVTHSREGLLLAIEGDDRMGADAGDDEGDQLLAPIGAIGPHDVDGQGEDETAKPEQGIGEGEVVLIGGGKQEEEGETGRAIQKDVDLGTEDVTADGRGERPGGIGIAFAPGGK